MNLLFIAVVALVFLGKKAVDTVENVLLDKKSFITKVSEDGAMVSRVNGIPLTIIVTQAAHESNYGTSKLATQGNNLFGIKAGTGWSGQTITLPTYEVIDGKEIKVDAAFRKYNSWSESIQDWFLFLSKDRYKYALAAARANNPTLFFKELQKAGYATDPNYATELTGVFNNIKEALA